MRGFVVATKCNTVEDFVEKYHSRVEDNSIFVGIVEERVLGAECAFAILLANQQPVFAGICEVLDIFRDANNPYQRRGMRLGIRRLGITSERIFADMTALRANKRRFARGSTAPPEIEADGIPISVEEDVSASIPIDLEEELTAPSVVTR
ncbi:MAG TPA: hypothetical protein VIV11_21770 [Kofleriaceae bacterium]